MWAPLSAYRCACRLHDLCQKQSLDAHALLLLLLRTAQRPLKAPLDREAVAAALRSTDALPPAAEQVPPAGAGDSSSEGSEAYDAAWHEADRLSDWGDGDEDFEVRRNDAFDGTPVPSVWRGERVAQFPIGTPGLARASVVAARAASCAAVPSSPALAFPDLPLPYVETQAFVHAVPQPQDLAVALRGPDGLEPTQCDVCYEEAAVAQQCLQLLLVRCCLPCSCACCKPRCGSLLHDICRCLVQFLRAVPCHAN